MKIRIEPIPKIQTRLPSRLPDEAVLKKLRKVSSDINISDEGRQLLEQQQEDAERLANHFESLHPEQLITPVTLREAGPEIAEFENLVTLFEATHSLDELRAIVDISSDLYTALDQADDLESPERIANAIKNYEKYSPGYIEEYKGIIAAARAIILSPEDLKKFQIRRSAKKDIAPIVKMLATLKNETNISIEKYDALKEKCNVLQKALGTMDRREKNKKVNHS